MNRNFARFVWLVITLSVIVAVISACSPQEPPTAQAPEPTAEATTPPLPPAGSNEVILTTGDWPPYVYETGGDPGPIAAIVMAAFQEQGIEPKIVFYPWKRAEDEVRQGKAFAAFPYARTPEREKEFTFSDPMYIVQAKFFYHKKYHPDGITFESLNDLRPYKIGGLLGTWYEPLFQEAGLQVEYVNSAEQNVEKLARGRVDLIVEEENTIWAAIRSLYPNEVDQFATIKKPLEQPGVVNDLRLMVSTTYPNSTELLAKFNAGLAAIRANGVYIQILQKYSLATEGQQ